MKRYDYIIAGGGAAGLSLTHHLAHSPLREQSILIIDRQVKNRNDHTWCVWTREPSYLDDLACRRWEQLAFFGSRGERHIKLQPYRYLMVRSADFYRSMRQNLESLPNIDFALGDVERITDTPDGVEVSANGLTLQGKWAFDSRYQAGDYRPLTPNHRYLYQHFLGQIVETERPTFDPSLPHWFDFRTPQHKSMRFVYLLPLSERRALIEYTVFSDSLLPQAEYRAALQQYIATVLRTDAARVEDEEQGLIPMTDYPFPRRSGQHILNIGTRGGRVKPSSGFAFMRIQRDSEAIVASLLAHDHPFNLAESPKRYRTFDAMLLQILLRRGDLGASVFGSLLHNNPIDRVFRFLDEEGNWGDNLKVMASVPPWPFIRAWLQVRLRRRP